MAGVDHVVALCNLVMPVVFLEHTEAKLVLVAMVASMTLMTFLNGIYGFTRVLGLGRIFWIPRIAFLWLRLDQTPPVDAFGIWMRVLISINAVSVIIDAIDVSRYLAGDRGELVRVCA